MIKIKLFLFVVLFYQIQLLIGQNNLYWVFFTDKKNTNFNPYEYFDTKAIERRLNINYSLYDSTDYPLNQDYVSIIKTLVDSTSYESRWLNAISVYAKTEQIEKIKKLPFVKYVDEIKYSLLLTEEKLNNVNDNTIDTSLLRNQTLRMEGHLFTEKQINGKGVRIAVFDGGFSFVDVHPAFKHLHKNNKIIKTYDFVKKREFVYSYHKHGTMVLSCIAGIYDNINMGLAPEAEFLLARTETLTEFFSEEVNWVAALEWADKNGADIVNSSLGYTYHRYFNYQMDGKTSYIAQVANMAVSKGILVINAAGNEGSTDWKIIGTPADAENVVSVAGIDPKTDFKIDFSSLGPATNGQLKPNLCAYGDVVAAGTSLKKMLQNVQGTSFAAPLVTGFAACVKQIYPKLSAYELKEKLEKAGQLYPYFDYAHGYGVPIASKILETNKEPIPTIKAEISNNTVIINTTNNSLAYNDKFKYHNYVFFKFSSKNNYIIKWGIIDMEFKNEFILPIPQNDNVKKITLHHRGYTTEVNLY